MYSFCLRPIFCLQEETRQKPLSIFRVCGYNRTGVKRLAP
ncbi:hypothetical protein HMPREF1869_00148 [Bacteroidales bacterium KA00251]|nr:hypothetical protein HMPREF1869_00148 [Bacteroidales bacterium KA00251]